MTLVSRKLFSDLKLVPHNMRIQTDQQSATRFADR